MGSTQSQERPEVVRIDRKDIPEGYAAVGVSSDVVNRVNAQQQNAGGVDAEKLRSELAREREEKAKLREEMARLSQLQQRAATTPSPAGPLSSDLEERTKTYQETVERVQQQFFQYHRENVCQDHEKEIMECLAKNPGRVLKCSQLAETYEKCVGDFRQQVLNGK